MGCWYGRGGESGRVLKFVNGQSFSTVTRPTLSRTKYTK